MSARLCRFLNAFFDKLEFGPIEAFCKVRQSQGLVMQECTHSHTVGPGKCHATEICAVCPAQECLDCRGTLLFTGIGKSGFIAQKVCQTLVSTGTKAVYLSPTDALHGDIGIVGRDDLVVMVSKSGATEELLRLVPYAKVSHWLPAQT
jgi:hypothetical protein